MPWTPEQQSRLQIEKNLVNKYFPDFQWYNPSIPGNAYLEGWMKTNSKNLYKLRLIIPIDIPNSVPTLLVVYPKPLYDYHYKDLSNLGFSAVMHTLTPQNGNVQICHYRANRWLPSITFYKVLMKGRLWLEAYEGHKSTGNNLDFYLSHQ